MMALRRWSMAALKVTKTTRAKNLFARVTGFVRSLFGGGQTRLALVYA